jgi:hypothetical protein
MKRMRLGTFPIASSAFACAALLSFGWSEQRGVSVSIESAQARVGRPLTPLSGAGVARRTYRRSVYGAGAVGAGVAGAAVAGTAAAAAATSPNWGWGNNWGGGWGNNWGGGWGNNWGGGWGNNWGGGWGGNPYANAYYAGAPYRGAAYGCRCP